MNSDVAAYYSAQHVNDRLPPFRLENIKEGEWPVLKGQNVKAANTRAFVPYVKALQNRAVSMLRSPKNRHMLKIITGLSGIIDILYGADTFLTSEQLAMLGTHIDLLARHYQKLSTDAFEAGQTLWHTVPKFHFVIALQ